MTLYRVKNWGLIYENNRSREIKSAAWVPIPNRHDDDAYLILVDRPNGAAMYGAWIAILTVASKCSPRGTLLRDNGAPHDAVSIARITRFKQEIINEALEVLTDECGVLEIAPPQEGAASPQEGALEQKGRNERTEGKELLPLSASQAVRKNRELWMIRKDLKTAEERRDKLANQEQSNSTKAKLDDAKKAVKVFRDELDTCLAASTRN